MSGGLSALPGLHDSGLFHQDIPLLEACLGGGGGGGTGGGGGVGGWGGGGEGAVGGGGRVFFFTVALVRGWGVSWGFGGERGWGEVFGGRRTPVFSPYSRTGKSGRSV